MHTVVAVSACLAFVFALETTSSETSSSIEKLNASILEYDSSQSLGCKETNRPRYSNAELIKEGDALRNDAAFMQRLRLGRLQRLRAELRRHKVAAAIIFDPINVRYAIDARSMVPFYLRNPTQYALVSAEEDGPLMLFTGSFGSDALTSSLVKSFNGKLEVHSAIGATMAAAGPRANEMTDLWVKTMDEILQKVAAKSPYGKSIAIERFQERALTGLRDRGYMLIDAQIPIEYARSIKTPEEVVAIKYGMKVVEEGVNRVRDVLSSAPNITENEIWSTLHQTVISCDGEYVETRLFNSGTKSAPWMQESGTKLVRAGESVLLDTDTVGPFGYYIDFSRTFIAGFGNEGFQATTSQIERYRSAREMVQHNMNMLRPGVSFLNLTFNAWPLPQKYLKNRYHVQTHGTGMTGEYPYVFHPQDWEAHGYDGIVKEGMTLSIEAYLGEDHPGAEGTKYEDHVLITSDGYELLSMGVPPESYLNERCVRGSQRLEV